jgi:hypothetical protein
MCSIKILDYEINGQNFMDQSVNLHHQNTLELTDEHT